MLVFLINYKKVQLIILTKNVKSDVFSARGIHQAYLAERFRKIPDDKNQEH